VASGWLHSMVRRREVVQGDRESGNGSHSNRVWCNDSNVAVGAKHRHTQGNCPHRLQQDNEAETMSGHVNVTRQQAKQCGQADKPADNSNSSLKHSKPKEGD
jgi:hypothetical protein